MRVEIIDNSKEVLRAKDLAIRKALESIGMQAEGYAKLLSPTDTGLLKNSITYAVSGESTHIGSYKADKPDKSGKIKSGSYSGTVGSKEEDSVYIGSNVSYSIYQELGTQRSKAQPFLKPAVENHIGEYKQIVENELKNA